MLLCKLLYFKQSLGKTDAETEAPILWPPHVKSWLIGKDSDAGRDWGQEEKEMTENEMAGWHHRLDAHEFGWTPGVGDRQGGLACCGSWGHKETDTTEQLNWTELNWGQHDHWLLVTGGFLLAQNLKFFNYYFEIFSCLMNTGKMGSTGPVFWKETRSS